MTNISISKIVTWGKDRIELVVVTVIAILTRGWVILRDDMWYDEAFTGLMMRAPWAQFWQVVTDDPHPPLYYLMLRGWTWVLGVNDLTMRLLPLIFGVLTVIVVYYIARELYNRETASIAALLLAVNPFLISYSIEARSYSFYGFLVALAFYFAVKKRIYLFAITVTLLVLVHYMTLVYIPILILYLFWRLMRSKGEWKKAILALIPFMIITTYIYLPVLTHSGNNNLNIDWVEKAGLGSIPRSITAYSLGVKSRLAGADEINNINFLLDEFLLGAGIFIVYLLGLIAAFFKERKDLTRFTDLLFLAGMVFGPMLVLITYTLWKDNNIYVERYLLPSAIFFVISFAYILTSLINWELIGILIFFYVFTITQTASPGYYTGMKLVEREIRSYNGEVVFTSPIDFIVGKYYFGENTGNLKAFNPADPDVTWNWPFIPYPESYPSDLEQAIFVSPDAGRMTDGYNEVLENTSMGNYKLYIRAGAQPVSL